MRRNEDGRGESFDMFVNGALPKGCANIGLLGRTQLAAAAMRTVVTYRHARRRLVLCLRQ